MLILLLATIFAILSHFLLIFKKHNICSHWNTIASSLLLKCLLFQAGLQLLSVQIHACARILITGAIFWVLQLLIFYYTSWNACFSRRDCNLHPPPPLFLFRPITWLEMPAFPGGIATIKFYFLILILS